LDNRVGRRDDEAEPSCVISSDLRRKSGRDP